MIVIGADENGFGPDLGPMVVTGVAMECNDYHPDLLSTIGNKPARIRDSKAVFSGQSSFSRGERATLPWLRVLGWNGHSFLELREFLCGAGVPAQSCPASGQRLCEGGQDRRLPLVCPDSIVEEIAHEIRQSLHGRLRLLSARSRFLCARAFHLANAGYKSKAVLDAHLMVDVIRELQKSSGGEVLAFCGRASGMRDYAEAITTMLPGFVPRKVSCDSAKSVYELPGVGHIEFVKAVEKSHSVAALASMIGKYLREVSLRLICDQVADGLYASGYPGDPKTALLIAGSTERRRAIGLPESCFLRRGAGSMGLEGDAT